MNMKKMTQDEFDKCMIFELIPDLKDEYGSVNFIVLTKKGKFRFAKECKECHELILIDKEYDIPSEITKAIGNNPKSYLEILTELDVVTIDEINECECFDDEVISNEEYEKEDEYEFIQGDEDCNILNEDLYDDVDEY